MDVSMFPGASIDSSLNVGEDARRSSETMATILNDQEIGRLIGTVIVNGDKSCIRPNSYVLRLGGAGEFLNSGKEFTLGAAKRGIKIQPGHSVALTALEIIDFRRETVRRIYPDHDLHAFISPTTDLSREGIVAPTTQVDAGFTGTLNWTLTNTSSEVRKFLHNERMFRMTIFKLAPGETPVNPYQGDYQGKHGYVRSERKGAPAGMRETEWEDSKMEGGPEASLENLIKSGYPWNLLGERLKVILGQFEMVTDEYAEIRSSIEKLTADLQAQGKSLESTVSNLIEAHTSNLQLKWTVVSVSAVGALIGIVLTILTNDAALRFVKEQGALIGILMMIICSTGIYLGLRKSK